MEVARSSFYDISSDVADDTALVKRMHPIQREFPAYGSATSRKPCAVRATTRPPAGQSDGLNLSTRWGSLQAAATFAPYPVALNRGKDKGAFTAGNLGPAYWAYSHLPLEIDTVGPDRCG